MRKKKWVEHSGPVHFITLYYWLWMCFRFLCCFPFSDGPGSVNWVNLFSPKLLFFLKKKFQQQKWYQDILNYIFGIAVKTLELISCFSCCSFSILLLWNLLKVRLGCMCPFLGPAVFVVSVSCVVNANLVSLAQKDGSCLPCDTWTPPFLFLPSMSQLRPIWCSFTNHMPWEFSLKSSFQSLSFSI